ncbi:MAG: hypothetical protein LQ344_000587 [Seirophora lacunosa]|nr:MAG: hypothetical protein LQ344_000587 [Seirophora lacunosa]
MFRRTSQKPPEALYAAFKDSYPNVGPGTITTTLAPTSKTTAAQSGPLSGPIMDPRDFGHGDDNKPHDSNFRPIHEEWRLSPSLMDANSFTFASFTNQASAYCTPGTGGMGTYYHNKAGDLHTPNLGFNLGTPLSLPHSDNRHDSTTAFGMQHFQPNFLDSAAFQTPNFGSQQAFAPSTFLHQDSAFGTMHSSNDNSPGQQNVVGHIMGPQKTRATLPPETCDPSAPDSKFPRSDKFRYRVSLNAPTAMVKHADEIPVTYLNKGQAYSVSISDSLGATPSPVPVRYRTVIRISFEDQQQRQRPAACWQLWKEGRGLAEAHQRGGKLQAVEYVDPNQGGDLDTMRPRVELERSSFDCFSVTWNPTPGASTADCTVSVRFNFLSTDFSHSKGVKGIPVRLCAKTEILSPGTPESPPGPVSEVCFCKVKLFRDHGAERKLSNDVAHIKKNIEKLKQQVNQVESGMKDLGKRKRSGSMAKSGNSRPAKVPKHKRTWSVSSEGSSGRPALEEDLHSKLSTLQNMFSSTRPYSLLYLKGYEDDDPDLYPVALPGQLPDSMPGNCPSRATSQERKASDATSPDSSHGSPSSAHSMPAVEQLTAQSELHTFSTGSRLQDDWEAFTHLSNPSFPHQDLGLGQTFSGPATKIQRSQSSADLPQWIDTTGIDPDYKAPPERASRAVACIYVLLRTPSEMANDDCYQAVYLMERNVNDLVRQLATKCGIEASRISRTVQVNHKGLKILVDNAVVRELPEGQDMRVELSESEAETALKQEPSSPLLATKFELRLHF